MSEGIGCPASSLVPSQAVTRDCSPLSGSCAHILSQGVFHPRLPISKLLCVSRWLPSAPEACDFRWVESVGRKSEGGGNKGIDSLRSFLFPMGQVCASFEEYAFCPVALTTEPLDVCQLLLLIASSVGCGAVMGLRNRVTLCDLRHLTSPFRKAPSTPCQ